MKVCVLSTSPKGNTSITLTQFKIAETYFKDVEFTYNMVPTGKFTDEAVASFKESDVVVFLSSPFHGTAPAYVHSLLRDMEQKLGIDALKNKPVTLFTTSGKQCEYNLHDFFKNWATRRNMYWIQSLSFSTSVESIDKTNIVCAEGREEFYCWFKFVLACTRDNGKDVKAKAGCKVSIIDGFDNSEDDKDNTVDRLKTVYENAGATVEVFHLRDYGIKPCTGCGGCYTTRECLIQDKFIEICDKVYLNTDIVAYATPLWNGTMGTLMKTFEERHMQFGRIGHGDGLITLFISTPTDAEYADADILYADKRNSILESLSHHFDFGLHFEKDLEYLAKQSVEAYNEDVYPPTLGSGKAVNLQFARLAHAIQNQEPADRIEYEENGYYEDVETVAQCRPILNGKDAAESNKGRLMPFNMALAGCKSIDKVPEITARRTYKSTPFSEYTRAYYKNMGKSGNKPDTDEKPSGLKGLFRRKG